MMFELVGDNGNMVLAISAEPSGPVAVWVEANVSGFVGSGEIVCQLLKFQEFVAKLNGVSSSLEGFAELFGIGGNSLGFYAERLGQFRLCANLTSSTGLAHLDAELKTDQTVVTSLASQLAPLLDSLR